MLLKKLVTLASAVLLTASPALLISPASANPTEDTPANETSLTNDPPIEQDVWVRITGEDEKVIPDDPATFSLLQQGEIGNRNWNSRFYACENYRITLDHCVGQRPACEIIGSRTLIFRSDFSMSGADRRVRVQPYVTIISETGSPLPEGITYEFVSDTSQPLAAPNTVFTETLHAGSPSGSGPTPLYALNQQSLAIPLVPVGDTGTRVNLRVSTTLDPSSLLRVGDATIRCSRAWSNSTANCVNPFVDPTLTFSRVELPYIAQNISSAIAAGQPSRLTRITSDGGDQNRTAACGTAAQRRLEQEQPKPSDMEDPSCDEYPFASSAEGGATAQTMWVPRRENTRQGQIMLAFLRNHQVQVNDTYQVELF